MHQYHYAKKLLILVFFGITTVQALDTNLEIRGAYFGFNSKTLRDVYSNGAPSVAIEAHFGGSKILEGFLNGEYIWKTGNTTYTNSKTRLQMGTLSVGPKIISKKHEIWRPYLGIGFMGGYIQTTDSNNYLKKNLHKWSCGVVGKFGLEARYKTRFFADLFFDYSYLPAHVDFHDSIDRYLVDFGGYRIGLGIGFRI